MQLHIGQCGFPAGALYVEQIRWTASPHAGRLTFHPDGKTLFGGCCDGLIRVWNVEDPESITERYHLDGHHGEVSRLAVSPDAAVLASADTEEKRLIVWDLASDGHKQLINHVWPGTVTSLAFAPDSRHLVVGMSNGVTYILRVVPPPK